MKVIALSLALALPLAGCALEPTDISIYGEHVSSISQHFGSDPTDYGYESIDVSARWQSRHGPFIELTDGYDPRPECRRSDCQMFLTPSGELFTFRAGWTWTLRDRGN